MLVQLHEQTTVDVWRHSNLIPALKYWYPVSALNVFKIYRHNLIWFYYKQQFFLYPWIILPVFVDENFTFTNELSVPQVEHPLVLESEKKSLADPSVLRDDEALTLLTEVWVWGENKRGELGLSDHMDRYV